MTKDEIIKLAEKCGIFEFENNESQSDNIMCFANLVAAAEREACAKAVEDYCGAWDDKGFALAAAIRARSNT